MEKLSFWVVEGELDSWKVAIQSSDQGEEEVYKFSCVEFIIKLIGRDILSKILPVQFPPLDVDKHFLELLIRCEKRSGRFIDDQSYCGDRKKRP